MSFIALHNGRPTTTVPLANRGFAYGDGLFETLKIVDGKIQFLREHLQRLQRDCARLDIAFDDIALRRELNLLPLESRSGVLKIVVTRCAAARGYAYFPNREADRFLIFYRQQFTEDLRARDGLAVRICRQRLSEQSALAGMKHLNRLEQVVARAEWSDPQITEGFMLDTRGRLVEGTMSNVFIVRNKNIFTPRLHRCGVAGVIREVILNRMLATQAQPVEADLTLDDLVVADEIFITNSLIGILPVQKVECIVKPVGAVTVALRAELDQLIASSC